MFVGVVFGINFREYMLLMGILGFLFSPFLTLLPVLSVDSTHSPLVMPNGKYMQIDEMLETVYVVFNLYHIICVCSSSVNTCTVPQFFYSSLLLSK